MKLFNTEILFQGKVSESILVHSFQEYKELGGKRDMFDVYAFIKERAKQKESDYISMMDMSISGIDIPEEAIMQKRLLAQGLWYILHLWFNRELRTVSFLNFDLDEFNKL